MNVSTEQLQAFAETGIRARLAELEHERQTLLTYLNGTLHDIKAARDTKMQAWVKTVKARSVKRKRKGMTAAQRKAVGVRMRKYWAAKRRTEA